MIVVAAVACVSVINIVSVNKQFEEAIADREALEGKKSELLFELENVDSAEYIEQQARTLLKMIRPGEIYYVVPDVAE
jgi:cell division protein FtsB